MNVQLIRDAERKLFSVTNKSAVIASIKHGESQANMCQQKMLGFFKQ